MLPDIRAERCGLSPGLYPLSLWLCPSQLEARKSNT